MATRTIDDLRLYEDDHYLVLNKPAGLSTLDDRRDPENVLKLVRMEYPEATVAHRLDKDTSGVLVVAKTAEGYRHLSIQFEDRQVTKIYHAVVDGRPAYNNEEVDAPIEKLPDGMVRISRRGKPSLTVFNTLEAFRTHAMVEARPVTGRTHQIRIHLALLGTPITGDATYGGKSFLLSAVKRGYKGDKEGEERPLMARMALHAQKITFLGLEEQTINGDAPYPKDFKALLNQLRRNNS
ncbi:MAG: RluA family pseudouridine synthase [Bacteroidota bacterium]